jgi:hypothetical protein
VNGSYSTLEICSTPAKAIEVNYVSAVWYHGWGTHLKNIKIGYTLVDLKSGIQDGAQILLGSATLLTANNIHFTHDYCELTYDAFLDTGK